MGLTNRQQVFVAEYLKCWNAAKAARLAGYNGKSNVVGSQLLANLSISAEIERRKAELMMSADEVLVRLTEQGRGDVGEFFKFYDGIKEPFLDLKAAHEAGLFRLVKKLKYNDKGLPEIELYDAQAALSLLGKRHGLFVDERRVTVTVEKELNKALDKLEQRLDANTYAAVLAALADGEAGEAETGADGASDPEIE